MNCIQSGTQIPNEFGNFMTEDDFRKSREAAILLMKKRIVVSAYSHFVLMTFLTLFCTYTNCWKNVFTLAQNQFYQTFIFIATLEVVHFILYIPMKLFILKYLEPGVTLADTKRIIRSSLRSLVISILTQVALEWIYIYSIIQGGAIYLILTFMLYRLITVSISPICRNQRCRVIGTLQDGELKRNILEYGDRLKMSIRQVVIMAGTSSNIVLTGIHHKYLIIPEEMLYGHSRSGTTVFTNNKSVYTNQEVLAASIWELAKHYQTDWLNRFVEEWTRWTDLLLYVFIINENGRLIKTYELSKPKPKCPVNKTVVFLSDLYTMAADSIRIINERSIIQKADMLIRDLGLGRDYANFMRRTYVKMNAFPLCSDHGFQVLFNPGPPLLVRLRYLDS